jgi:hypothetical protein
MAAVVTTPHDERITRSLACPLSLPDLLDLRSVIDLVYVISAELTAI